MAAFDSFVRNLINRFAITILTANSYQGNFGNNYGSAAYVALFGYQQLTSRQVLYPGYNSLGFTTTFTLKPNTSVLFTFSGKPQLGAHGFWSMAYYGADQYLIPNPLNRFEVGDRTYSYQFQDGTGPVYGTKANSTHDGPFQILAQPADLPPPSNWTGNWLPASSSFSMIGEFFTVARLRSND